MRTAKKLKEAESRRVANAVLLCLVLAGILSSFPHHASEAHMAYIGPGAGFAFLGSFLTLIAGFVLGLVSFLLLAVSDGLAAGAPAQRFSSCSREEGHLSRAGWPGPAAH